jgi:hypothetical protein
LPTAITLYINNFYLSILIRLLPEAVAEYFRMTKTPQNNYLKSGSGKIKKCAAA